MKNKLPSIYALFWAMISGIIFLSSSGNPPDGHTGAPPTGNTCASAQNGCHSGGTGIGNVTIIGLPTTIASNTLYPLQVKVTRINSAPQLAGFQLVVQDATDVNSGTLSDPGTNSTLQTSGGHTYFEHNPAVYFTANTIFYTVNWTSPASATNPIRMYAAANLANGDFSPDGDAIVLTNVSGNLAPAITLDVTGTNVSCFEGSDGSATAAASGGGGPPYTYNWSNTDTGPTISDLPADTYSVTVTNPSGGLGTGSIVITEPSSPVGVSIVNQVNVTCANPLGSATAAANGGTPGYSYAWSSGATGPTAALPAGTFTLTATDNNGCTAENSVTISANTTPPVANAGPCMALDCNTGSVPLDGSGSSQGANFSYQWTGPGIVSGGNTTTPTVNLEGNYVILVTDVSNGCTASASVAVFACPGAIITPGSATTFCPGGSVLLTASAGASYLWSTAETTAAITVFASGLYTVSVTDANGCTLTASQAVTVLSAQNTWTGAGNGILWSDGGNWSEGVVPIACQEVVTPAGSTVAVPAGFNAVAKMLEVAVGAELQVEVAAGLEIGN